MPELTPAQVAAIARLETLRGELWLTFLSTKSANTLRAYKTDVADFQAFCLAQGLLGMPASPATLARYVVSLVDRGLKPSTILRRRASISVAHHLYGIRLPDASDLQLPALFGNVRRQLQFTTKKKPITIDDLRLLVSATPQGSDRRQRSGAAPGWFRGRIHLEGTGELGC